MNLIDYLQQTVGICDVWVDGSFVTEKPDPDDIDLTILIPGEVLDRLEVTDPMAVQDFAAAIDQEAFSPDLHVFVIVSRPRDHPDRAAFGRGSEILGAVVVGDARELGKGNGCPPFRGDRCGITHSSLIGPEKQRG